MTLWVGTYREKGGGGLYPLRRRGDDLVAGSPEPAIANASFAAHSAQHGLYYFVDEQEDGRVRAWRYAAGKWAAAGECRSGGALPCFVSISPDEHWLAVANYGDGTVGLVRLDPQTGQPIDLAGVHHSTGRGTDPERQDGPHAHCVVFDEDSSLFHVDLGLDRVLRHEITPEGFGQTAVAFETPAGWGPRHLVLHPDGKHALLLCELAARLLLLRRDGETMTCLDSVATAPEPSPENLGGHLSLAEDGTVLVTNRGHDSLARFAIADGRLSMLDCTPTGGSSPRHFVRDRDGFVVAHEEDGGITRIRPGESGARQIAPLPGTAFIIEVPD